MATPRRSCTVAAILFCVTVLRGASTALECYSCSGEDCAKVATVGFTTVCPNPEDVCYSRFDATNLLATGRGCLVAAEVATCTGTECVTCSDADLCNDAGSPQHKCLVCSSVTDGSECIEPANGVQLVAKQCPAATGVDLTKAQCYARLVGTSVTERGCITSQRHLDECSGSGCTTCTGTGCNNAEFPSNRQQCVSCDGAACTDEASSVTYCDDPYDVCVSLRRANGNVMKSCEKAMTPADAAYCTDNPSRCTFCGKQRCNGVPFETGSTAAPVQCYACEGTGCLRSSALLTTCRLYDDDCFSSFTGLNPSQRGCLSGLTTAAQIECKAGGTSGSLCAICTGTECNLQGHPDHRCLSCSSVKDTGGCIDPSTDRSLQPVQCPAPTTEITAGAHCLTKSFGIVTERGCISSAADLLGCEEALGGGRCSTCSVETGGPGCNANVFPSDRRRCTIGTAANAFCADPLDDCVQLQSSAGIRKRTCRSSLSDTERSYCAANSNRCRFCSTDNCNAAEITFDYLECLSCDSSVDQRCATNPAALSTYDRCVTCASALIVVAGKATTRRGCLASLPAEVSQACTVTPGTSTSCQRCSTNHCNVANFPANRLQCYRCSNPPCVSHEAIQLEYCPYYAVNDSCILQKDTGDALVRLDCRSSLTDSEQLACTAGGQGRCQSCSTAACNNPTGYSTTGSCVRCRSSLNPLCRDAAQQLEPEPCSDPTNSVCYTRLVDAGSLTAVTERGCLSELTSAEQERCTRGDLCLPCSSRVIANCNTNQYPVAPLTCYQCDSRTDGDACKASQLANLASECPRYDPANKCYTIVQSNGDTVRKCSTAAREVECATSSACEVCLFRGCNARPMLEIVVTEPPGSTTTPGPTGGGATATSCPLVFSLVALLVAIRELSAGP
ncbi:uncharacterized protein LOC118463800 [Anopheles albimanus]|uniref:DUF753 domain-containing protein n=1 Tax=Anopheles albimanus TaxID=7167 RepID=A0A182FFV0_ANOAL|nr:uncharacterized protein LOC118463800 [Anopheles albimanus]